MTRPSRMRVPALAAAIAVLLVALSVPAFAAGKKIFITKTDENFMGQAGVTFELYKDNPPVGGARGNEDTKVDTQVTDAAGSATFADVAAGDYWVHEVTPAGYKDNPDEAVKIGKKNKEIVFSNTPKAANNRVNDPTSVTSFDLFEFDPSIAAGPGEDVLVGWNDSTGFHPPGNVSGISTALSGDLGTTWGDQVVGIPTGSDSIFYLAQPSVVYDPIFNRWVVAADSFVFAQQGLTQPILVSTSGGQFGFWNNPVNTFPGIPPQPAGAHGADLAIDVSNGAHSGNLYLGFTLSHGNETSETMLTRSTNGGDTWRDPISVSGLGTFDNTGVAVAPNGNVFVTYTDYGGSQSPSFDILISRSTDGGQTFGPPHFIRQGSAKSGTPGQCSGSSTLHTVLGAAAVFDANQIVVDPFNSKHIFAAYPIHGQGVDESDVFYTTSGDSGQTWSAPELVGPSSGTQFAPQLAVTPDGRAAITYYQSLDGSTVDPTAVFYDPYADEFVGEPESLTDGNPFPVWNIDPSFDTSYGNCFGLGGPAVEAPGSGFFFAWADGRDPGPAGNNGIDPNIYLAHDLGPFLGTSTSLSVSKTASKLKATGDVTPQPLKGAIVRVRLFRDTGGGFEQVASKQAKTGKGGSYSASFARPDGGTCRITVVFQGSEGREPSPSKSKTFAC